MEEIIKELSCLSLSTGFLLWFFGSACSFLIYKILDWLLP